MDAQQEKSTNTYLSFQLDEEVFATNVKNVHQVVGFKSVTHLPGAPNFIRGVIDIRGKMIPVIDLRLKFGLTETKRTASACIIVIDLEVGEDMLAIGALADSVHDVFEFETSEIKPAPQFSSMGEMEHIKGIGRRNDKFIIILDLEQVFSTEEVVTLGSMETTN